MFYLLLLLLCWFLFSPVFHDLGFILFYLGLGVVVFLLFMSFCSFVELLYFFNFLFLYGELPRECLVIWWLMNNVNK